MGIGNTVKWLSDYDIKKIQDSIYYEIKDWIKLTHLDHEVKAELITRAHLSIQEHLDLAIASLSKTSTNQIQELASNIQFYFLKPTDTLDGRKNFEEDIEGMLKIALTDKENVQYLMKKIKSFLYTFTGSLEKYITIGK